MAKRTKPKIRATANKNLVAILDAQIFDYSCDDIVALEGTHWWCAFFNGEAVAYAGAKLLSDGVVYLNRAGVLPDFRGQGLQGRLIKCRLKWAKKSGASKVITYTMRTNHRSSNNLIKCGFQLYEPAWPWVGGDVLYWVKDI